jgi:hypothetical protein
MRGGSNHQEFFRIQNPSQSASRLGIPLALALHGPRPKAEALAAKMCCMVSWIAVPCQLWATRPATLTFDPVSRDVPRCAYFESVLERAIRAWSVREALQQSSRATPSTYITVHLQG